MNNNNFDYNKITSYYPYGELPLKYTKQGQEQLKKELKNNSSSAFFNTSNNFYDIKTNNTSNSAVESISNEATTNKTVDVQNNSNNSNSNFDFNTILPLLSNFGDNSKIRDLIPLISKGGNLGMNDLLKLFSSFTKQKTPNTKTILEEGTYINSLKKVE